jgi:hypothetical protein
MSRAPRVRSARSSLVVALIVLSCAAVRAQQPQRSASAAAHAAATVSTSGGAAIPPSLVPPLEQLAADGCAPQWVPTFGATSSVDYEVRALLAWDDGSGPALYVGGIFSSAGALPGTTGLARWDGTSWSSVGGGVEGSVEAMTVFDDGSGGGPVLVVAGAFIVAGGLSAHHIAQWDGGVWSALGDGLEGGTNALAVFDDGGGPELYAGGNFLTAGGVVANGIARWDGDAWSAVGAGLTGSGAQRVLALAVHDDGGGPALYAGGHFTEIDSVPALRVARWDGADWRPVGSGMIGTSNPEVRCLTVADLGLGSGPLLYAGGSFKFGPGLAIREIAAWDGTSWREVGGGVGNGPSGATPWVSAIAVYDDGSGLALYAGGRFAEADGVTCNHIARFDGSDWSALDGGIDGKILTSAYALCVFDDLSGAGPRLQVGGSFEHAGLVGAEYLAAWDGGAWSAVAASPQDGLNGEVLASLSFDDGRGGGPALFVGGAFSAAGGATVDNVARWDGEAWSPAGSGLNGYVRCFAVFDDGLGGGPKLYAGGDFTSTGLPGPALSHIARWSGADWEAVPDLGLDEPVWSLVVHDDGSGPALYAGGDFTIAGGEPGTQHVARFDGTHWSALAASGMAGGDLIGGEIYTWVDVLEVFDDGSGGGPALFAGGVFKTAGGVSAQRIAKWNGTAWSPLSSGLTASFSSVTDFEVFDDGLGSGPGLYVGGGFSIIGGASAVGIARWNGSSFSPVGGGLSGSVQSLAVLDDGSGSALFVGGSFALAGAVTANGIARWDGTSWAALASGVDGGGEIWSLGVVEQPFGLGQDLIGGGDFLSVSGVSDTFIARWSGCPVTPSAWSNLGYALAGAAGPPLLAGTGALETGSSGTLALSHASPSAFSVLFVSLGGVSAPFKCGTLVPVPVALQFSLFTNGAGNLPLGWAAWPGGLSGLSLYFQFAVQDPAALCGVALSNALRADVP